MVVFETSVHLSFLSFGQCRGLVWFYEGSKGYFRDPWSALFISCEMWNSHFFFLVNRDFHSCCEPWFFKTFSFIFREAWNANVVFFVNCERAALFSVKRRGGAEDSWNFRIGIIQQKNDVTSGLNCASRLVSQSEKMAFRLLVVSLYL